MIRPTSRAVVASVGVVIVAAVTAGLFPANWMIGLALIPMLVILILFDAFLTPLRSSLIWDIQTPDVLYTGTTDELVLSAIPQRGYVPRVVEIVCDVNPKLEQLSPQHLNLAEGQGSELSLALVPLRRGMGQIERLWLRWRGPFGLVQRISMMTLDRDIRIIPNIKAVQNAAIEFSTKDAMLGVKVDRWRGDGSEFEALREFVPGHDLRNVDWKQSARHRQILAKEFRTERNHQVVLAFDTGHLMVEPFEGLPRLDHAINAGLLTALMATLSEDQVGLFAFDSRVRQYIKPTAGKRAFSQLQLASADLEYHFEETNFTLGLSSLQTQLRRRALVIVFTEFVDSITSELMVDNFQRLSNKHEVIFVTLRDPYLSETVDIRPWSIKDVAQSVVASDLRNEREIVLERLSRMGVHCLEVTSAEMSSTLISTYLRLKARERI